MTDFAVTVGPAARRDLDDYIIWLREEDGVEIVRVLHAAQDWWALLDLD